MQSVKEIVQTLEKNGLSKYAIAKDIGTSVSQISKYANGVIRQVGLVKAIQFYEAYGVIVAPYTLTDLVEAINKNKARKQAIEERKDNV